jgi:peptide/nickel transport system permease protein
VSHGLWLRRRLSRSLRARLGALVLACIALPAIFAELLASEAPIAAFGERVELFPGVFHPEAYRAADPARHANDACLWPLVRHGPDVPSRAGPLAPASLEHPLGTDGAARDVFARVLYGGRIALGLALAALVFSLLLGATLGAVAGYFGGVWDEILARPIELVQAFPTVFVVVVWRAIFPEGSVWSLALAVAAVRWAEVARLVRAEVVRSSVSDHVLAARAIGCSHGRILWRHVLPAAARPTIESSLFGVASVVLLEVSLSFLGLGSSGSWGALIAEGLASGQARAPSLWGGLALVLTVASSYLLADAVSEAIDARVATLRPRELAPEA